MTGYQSKKAAARDKLVVTDLDGHVVRGVRKQKKVAALDKLEDDDALTIAYQSGYYDGKKAAQPAQEPVCPACKAEVLYECVACSSNNYPSQPAQKPVAHCEAGPEYCVQCKLEDRSIVLAAAVRYVKNNTPPLVSDEICRALATPPQPAQEPVAWRDAAIRLGEELSSVGPNGYYDMGAKEWLDWSMEQNPKGKHSLPQRPWVGLTEEEFDDLQIENIDDPWANFKAIEAKLKEKNT